jgi:lipid-A-disaccharide synthase
VPNTAFIVATEASADRHGARLAACLREQTGLEWFGIGGDAMAGAGVELLAHAREFSVLGIFEVLRHYPRLYGVARRVLAEVDKRKPRIAIVIDSASFNRHMCRQLHRRGIPVVYFIAPQLWAWRPRRVKYLQKYVRKLLCLFPFEEKYFRNRGVDTDYVGHPLVDSARAGFGRGDFFRAADLDPAVPLVTLMPGSRNQEVERHLPVILEALEKLADKVKVSTQYCLIQPDTVDSKLLERLLQKAPHIPLTVLHDTPYNALAWSEAAVISSGTATVEALLLETPMVVVYRVSAASWQVGKMLIQTPYYSMVNLVAEEQLVPELIQEDFTAQRLAEELHSLLSDTEGRSRIQQKMGALKGRLGEPGAIERAANIVASLLPSPANIGERG